LRDWAICLAIIAISLIALRVARKVILKKIKTLAAGTKTTIDDFFVAMVEASLMPLLYVLAFYFGLKYISVSQKVSNVLHIVVLVIVMFFFLRMITSFVSYVFQSAFANPDKDEQRLKQSRGIVVVLQAIIWLIGFLFLINNLGYDITTLIAGMGIGGIAIALAAQTILGDLFSYFVIFFDKPFEIGDFIIVQDKMGTVEYIGIKTTRLKTLNGEQLICSNTDLTNSRVHNFKRMQEKRILFSFGVVYSTPAAKLKGIPKLVALIIEEEKLARFDRAHFKEFGAFSLNFEVVYYVLSPDYNLYMEIQQRINLLIYEVFEKEQIEFAFPTQTLYLNKTYNPDSNNPEDGFDKA
jgi:small-conductance mechanosensitive channel